MMKEKFKTKLLASVFLGTFFASSPAVAFFLGNLEVKSKFGEKFEASFEIHLDNDEGYEVALGKASDYKKLGLSRPTLINSLLLEKPVGKIGEMKVVHVLSKIPLFFPSFNLVVIAKHNGGTLLENYLITVDFQKGLALNTFGIKKKKTFASSLFKPPVAKNEISAKKKEVSPSVPKNGLFLRDKGMRLTLKPERQKTSEKKVLAIKPTSVVNISKKRRGLSGAIWAVPKKIFPATKMSPKESFSPKPRSREGKRGGPLVTRFGLIELNEGEGLFSVARKIKIKDIHPSRIEVALWIKNIGKFIYGNINGFKDGTELELQGIEKLAEKIDLQTAKNILNGQAKEWKITKEKVGKINTTKPEIKEAPLPLENVDQIATIFDWVEEWESSWEKNDIGKHISFYRVVSTGKKKQNLGKESFPGERKKKLLAKFPGPRLTISNHNLISKPRGPWMVFEQQFFSKTMESNGTKEIRMERVDGNWKIAEEQFYAEKHDVTKLLIRKGKNKIQNSRPFVIHVSSHSREVEAISFSNKLRQNGYDAYSAPVRISKGVNIYRVYIGRFATWEQAHRTIKTLQESNLQEHSMVIPYPFALQVGEVGSMLEAKKTIKNLRLNGVSGFLSNFNSSDSRAMQFGVCVGAFKKPENAVWLMQRLEKAGFSFKIIRP